MYAKIFKQKKFGWGGRAFAARFPAGGAVSIVGSVAGGYRHSGSREFSEVHVEMLLEGTRRHTKREIQETLDGMGATLEFSANSQRLIFVGHVRTKHVEKFLQLVAELLREPAFPQKELAVLKKREAAALQLAQKDPNTQARIGLSRLIYPHKHPSAYESTAESLAVLRKITSDELRRYHEKVLSRRSLIISVAGDIEAPRAFSLVEKCFTTLPDKKTAPLPPIVKAHTSRRPKKLVVPIADKASATYSAGIATGIPDTHPDYAALLLGVQALGSRGGFTGRLMQRVREEQGLTYGTYSYLPPASFEGGLNGYVEVWATFAPTLLARGREAIAKEVRAIVAQGPQIEELRKHMRMYESRAKVQLATSGDIARIAHALASNGKDLSHIDSFLTKVRRLTLEDVHAALKKYLKPEQLCEIAAGPVKKNSLN